MFKFKEVRFQKVVNNGTVEEKRLKIYFTVLYAIDGISKEELLIVQEDGSFESNLDENFQKYVDIQYQQPKKGMSNSERIVALQAVENYVRNLIKDLDFPT